MTAETLPNSEAEYEAIESAVLETARGRWFLREHARRNRQADTTLLLSALAHLEETIREDRERSIPAVSRLLSDLLDMAAAISRLKREIAAIRPASERAGPLLGAPASIDIAADAAERANRQILAAGECIQETAWVLREQGLDHRICNALDGAASDISAAAAIWDVTARRVGKVVEAMNDLEIRLNAAIAKRETNQNPAGMNRLTDEAADPPRLTGPMATDELAPFEIDRLIWPDEAEFKPEEAEVLLEPPYDNARHDGDAAQGTSSDESDGKRSVPPVTAIEEPAIPEATAAPAVSDEAPAADNETIAAQPSDDTEKAAGTPPAADEAPQPLPVRRRGNPLAAINALSYEEKIALFS